MNPMLFSSRKPAWIGGLAALVMAPIALAAEPSVVSPDGLWIALQEVSANKLQAEPGIQPDRFRAFTIEPAQLRQFLDLAPREVELSAWEAPLRLTLPSPTGYFGAFEIWESPIMAPELAAKFPEIRTFCGQGIDDPAATVRLDWTPAGFHAQVLSPSGAYYIDPYFKGDAEIYACYAKRDYRPIGKSWQCLVDENPIDPVKPPLRSALKLSGDTLRTYRLALAATGEYTAFHGGTKADAMAAIVTTLNRVVGIYEIDLAIRMVLVANNDQVIYTNSSTDPYSNNNGVAMLSQNTSTLNSVIGSSNYDIGHVFSTGGGGVAYLNAVCGSLKAGGVTGSSQPIGDPFDVDFVAHEMGHQFGGTHSFNGKIANCSGGNRNGSTAYEPGSGSTIMAYAGICGSDDLQPHSDPYFHSVNLDQMFAFITTGGGSNCDVSTATGNSAPTVNAGPNTTIPRGTPFTLTAAGSDPDMDPLTYNWEERDLGPAQALPAADNGSSPIFRSFDPVTSPSRTFPRLSDILGNTSTIGEWLPTTDRTLNFRVTVRDNRAGGGGVGNDDMSVTVTTSAGPFVVTAPNSPITTDGALTVTWDVAATAGPPVNAALVNILASVDGGNTFPFMLVSNTPNDGSENVTLPPISTSMARIKIEAANNIFFDISDTNFTIDPGPPIGPTLVWVDFSYTGAEAGTQTKPYNTLPAALLAVASGGTIRIKAGSSNTTIMINQNVRIEASGGLVTLGP